MVRQRTRNGPASLRWCVGLAGSVLPSTAGHAQDGALRDTIVIGTAIGTVMFAVLATLIGLSVVAKLLIVFGMVPRTPGKPVHRIVHGLATIVGRLKVTPDVRPRRRRF